MASVINSFEIDSTPDAKRTNELGMRLMQQRVWAKKDSKNLLIKSPPASGKSRALMFVALDKKVNQGVKKAIVAVPETSIGSSFKSTNLTTHGFYENWHVPDKYNLCLEINEIEGAKSKVKAFLSFMEDDSADVLLCTHSTLRTAFKELDSDVFEGCLVAIDEFHHLSVAEDNRIGEVVSRLLENEKTHVIGMTGSYFRGDSNAVLMPEHEAKFDTVTFTFYEQMQGYQFLKKLNIGHHFYPAVKNDDVAAYIDGIRELYDPSKKTIIHIPHPSNKESEDKYAEYDAITDVIGDFMFVDVDTGLSHYKCQKSGEVRVVANLVDDGRDRSKVQRSLRDENLLTKVDVLVAVGMAKEGFDWPAAEYAITVGARGSLTEIIQIIGRVTRDYEGKTEATFINLIKEPLVDQMLVEDAVNDILKAISASLLMEQVISPKFDFKSRGSKGKSTGDGGLNSFTIEGFTPPKSERVKEILSQDRNSLLVDILNSVKGKDASKVLSSSEAGADFLSQVLVPRVVVNKYGEDHLTDDEVDQIRSQLILELNMPAIKSEAKKRSKGKGGSKDDGIQSSKAIIEAANKLNVHDLSLDMIEKVNPFMNAYEVVAKSITPDLLSLVRSHIKTHRGGMSLADATALFGAIKRFRIEHGKPPSFETNSDREYQLAEAMQVLAAEKARRDSEVA